ncbi:MAG TPA: hypothetical protein VLA75_02595 [Thermoanaerobaculia bacterium]|nr:hypothetical protein [Thermoanaerobaculia bacterium]
MHGRSLRPPTGLPTPARALLLAFGLGLGLFSTPASPAAAWSEATRHDLALRARDLAPPDLARQLHRHETEWLTGARGAAGRAELAPREAASGLATALRAAVEAVREHRPMAVVAARMGALAGFAAELNDPLSRSARDPRLARLAPDFERYVDSARGRFTPVFYGLDRGLGERGGVEALAHRALARGAPLRSAIAREYERVGYRPGREAFDDRSTAFAVGAIAYSRALTDTVQLLRHAWIQAGGADLPGRLHASGGPIVRLAPARRAR